MSTSHMPRCGTCKHFKAEINRTASEGFVWAENPGELIQRSEYGQCGRIATVAGDGAKAVAVDGSGYFAAIICTKDFGCVLHESVG